MRAIDGSARSALPSSNLLARRRQRGRLLAELPQLDRDDRLGWRDTASKVPGQIVNVAPSGIEPTTNRS
jgi:hypothetical protein